MARNFTYRNYLVSINLKFGQTVEVPYDNDVKRDFKDISTLDLATLDIKGPDKKAVLRRFNPAVYMDGNFVVASYPHTNGKVNVSPALFDFEDEKSKYYIDNLKYFARQRHEKVSNGDNVVLDRDAVFDKYVYDLLDDILRSNNKGLISENSLLSKTLKDLIREKDLNQGTSAFINAHTRIKNIFANYTQLRIMTYEYLLAIHDYNPEIRRQFEAYEKADIKGMEPKIPEPKQMTMDQFIDDPMLGYELRLANKSKRRANR